MLEAIRNKRDREQGFTLIELMVVVLIIAILIAIAIPTFLGARERAQDKAAQSSLRNGLTAAKVIYTDGEDFADATTTALLAVEPSLGFVDSATASTDPKEVSVDVSDAPNTIYMASYSKSGTCFYIKDNVQGPGTTYGSGTTCTGAAAKTAAPAGTSW